MNKLLSIFIGDVEEQLKENETILLQDGANLFRGSIALGGQLTLTSSRIIFKPHLVNFDRNDEIIELDRLKGVKKVKTLDLFDTSLRVTTDSGDEFKFVLNANTRDKWYDTINCMI